MKSNVPNESSIICYDGQAGMKLTAKKPSSSSQITAMKYPEKTRISIGD